jgi:DNA primase
MPYENKRKEFRNKVNIALSNDDEEIAKQFGTETEPAGQDTRLQPCSFCHHNDCATITPGKPCFNCFHPGCEQGLLSEVLARRFEKPEEVVLKELAKKYNIPVPVVDEAEERRQKILSIAVAFYQEQLLANPEAMAYLLNTRKRLPETIKTMRIGLGGNLRALVDKIHEEDIDLNADAWNLFVMNEDLVYPYRDPPHTGEILRLNTKPIKSLNDPEQKKHGFSVGKRVLYRSPKVNREMAIVVEGENDLMALLEKGAESVVALGGKPSADVIEELAEFKSLCLMLDNDDAGKNLTNELNNELPHIPVYQIQYDTSFKDPDEYYRDCPDAKPIADLIAAATELETDKHRLTHKGDTWIFATRKLRMELKNLSRSKSGEFSGTLTLFEGDKQTDVSYGQKLTSYTKQKEFAMQFQTDLEEYCDKGFERRDLNELLDIYQHSQHKASIIPALAAKYLEQDERNVTAALIAKRLGHQVLEQVLQDANEINNQGLGELQDIPKMKTSSFYSVKNDEAFFYFTNIVNEDGLLKKLPFLLSNHKESIPLYLFKKKTEHSLLLVNQKYELPGEVNQAIGELDDISLSQVWADKFSKGEVNPEEYIIGALAVKIVNYIKKFYFHTDERVYKVLAIWIIGTYYYELFKCYPYLFLNGKKGSGKSRLDQVIRLFCINPKYGVNMTGAALFRAIDVEGGTIIIDEIENITSKNNIQESDLATVLKAGYEEGAKAYRCEGDTKVGFVPRAYSVYSPKVISNINGVDAVIEDRCVVINSFEAPAGTKLEDPKMFKEEHRAELKEITSKCCLSALEHFQEVYKTFRELKFDGISARMSQIMAPLITIARLSGTDFETALIGYYQDTMVDAKLDAEDNTPAGLIPRLIKRVALELLGRTPKDLTNMAGSKYNANIELGEGGFEITDLHLKVWVEEHLPGTQVSLPDVNKLLKRAMHFESSKRTSATVGLEFERDFNGNTKINVWKYTFQFSDVVPDYQPDEEKAAVAKAAVIESTKKEERSKAAFAEFMRD